MSPFLGIPMNPTRMENSKWLQLQVDQEWPTWGMMWTSVCGWRFNCPRSELNGNCADRVASINEALNLLTSYKVGPLLYQL